MFKIINNGTLPKRFTRYSCGFDVFANEDVVIGAGETKLIGLGICLDDNFVIYDIAGVKVSTSGEILNDGDPKKVYDFLQSHYLELHPRSSLRAKGITSLGSGVIDIDYKDEIKMIIHNPIIGMDTDGGLVGSNWNSNFEIKKGDRIGQLILCRHEGWLLPDEYTKHTERAGGFGSSGERNEA